MSTTIRNLEGHFLFDYLRFYLHIVYILFEETSILRILEINKMILFVYLFITLLNVSSFFLLINFVHPKYEEICVRLLRSLVLTKKVLERRSTYFYTLRLGIHVFM